MRFFERAAVDRRAGGRGEAWRVMETAYRSLTRSDELTSHELAPELLLTIARAYASVGELDRAEELLQKAKDELEKLDTADELLMARVLEHRGRVRLERDNDSGALSDLTRCLELRSKELGERSAEVATTRTLLARTALARGDLEEARHVAVVARRALEAADATDAEPLAEAHELAAEIELTDGDPHAAEEHARAAVALLDPATHPDDPGSSRRLVLLARTLLEQDRAASAEPLLRLARALQNYLIGPNSPGSVEAMLLLTEVDLAQERYPEALLLVDDALGILEDVDGPAHQDRVRALEFRARALVGLDRTPEADEALVEAAQLSSMAEQPSR